MKYIDIELGDKKYFHIFIGKRVLKKELSSISGDIPLYSANVFEPFGFINESNINKFEFNSITWGIDGNFEIKAIDKGVKFATTDHCGTIQILDTSINSQYLLYSLYLLKEDLSFSRNFRASLSNMKKVSIKFPLDESNSIDATIQDILAKKYMTIVKKKNEVRNVLDEIKKFDISISYEEAFKNLDPQDFDLIKVEDIVDFSKTTNNSYFTKEFVSQHPGDIPVYGASKYEDEVGYGYIEDNMPNVKYFENCLTWNIDGSIGLFYREGRFSLSEKVIPLVFQRNISEKIDKHYFKYSILNEVFKNPFSFSYKGGKSRLGEISIKVPKDIKQQEEINNLCFRIDQKNEALNEIKDEIVVNTKILLDKQIDIS